MNYQNKSQESYNLFDPLHSVNEIQASKGRASGSKATLLELFGDELGDERQDQPKNSEQGVNLIDFATQHLIGFVHGLMHLNIDFNSYLLSFQMPLSFNEDSFGNLEKVKTFSYDFLMVRI